MDFGLRDRVAVVMAGSAGLGRAVALALSAEGARVAICARDEARLQATQRELENSHPGGVVAEALDVTHSDALVEFLERVHSRWGRLDILVTNAGGPPPGRAHELTLERLEEGYRITLRSAVVAIRTVLPWMRAARWGRIIALTSMSVRQPIDNLVVSTTMRSALTGYLKTLSREVATDGVLVNSICTGMFMTDRLQELVDLRARESGRAPKDELARMAADIPLGRVGEPSELGSLVAFLASEKASFVNGVALPVDGGADRHLL